MYGDDDDISDTCPHRILQCHLQVDCGRLLNAGAVDHPLWIIWWSYGDDLMIIWCFWGCVWCTHLLEYGNPRSEKRRRRTPMTKTRPSRLETASFTLAFSCWVESWWLTWNQLDFVWHTYRSYIYIVTDSREHSKYKRITDERKGIIKWRRRMVKMEVTGPRYRSGLVSLPNLWGDHHQWPSPSFINSLTILPWQEWFISMHIK